MGGARLEREAVLHGVSTGRERGKPRGEFLVRTGGEKPELAEVDAEHRNRRAPQESCGAEEGAVPTEREEGVDLIGPRQDRRARDELGEASLDVQGESMHRRLAGQERQDIGEAVVAAMADDAEPSDHPASAPLSAAARTARAIPSASMPHCASCRARDAA